MASQRFGSIKLDNSIVPHLLMTAWPRYDTTVSVTFTNLALIPDEVSMLYTNVNIVGVNNILESDYILYRQKVDKTFTFQPIVLEAGYSLYVSSINGTTSVNAYGFAEEF